MEKIYKKWWFWVLFIFVIGIISSVVEELRNNDKSSISISSNGVDNTQRYLEVTIEDLQRNPYAYENKPVAFSGTVYFTNTNNKDWIWNITNGNTFNISITRKCVAVDEDGNYKGYLVVGDKCAVGGVLKFDQYGSMFMETEKIIIFEE